MPDIPTESVDTGDAERVEHRRSPGFLNTKQFPPTTFGSTAIKAVQEGYEIIGRLTLRGATKTVVFAMQGGPRPSFRRASSRRAPG